ncbi:MAG: glycerol dehydrogenase [Ignisphaera sp.]
MMLSFYVPSMNIKTFGTAGRYIQGPGSIKLIGEIAKNYNIRKPLVFADNIVMNVIEKYGLFESFTQSGIDYVKEFFGKTSCGSETCDEEIQLLSGVAKSNGCDAVVVAGGGKAIDTGKAVANNLRLPLIVIPTIASTDAPCSSVAVIYTCDHVFKEYRFYPKGPDVVLVDTEIIAKAPPRFLACGIGDAMGKYTEVPSSVRAGAKNLLLKPVHGYPPMIAIAAQKLMIDILFDYSEEAIESVELGVVTPALEAVVEATTLLSQIAFEDGGLSAAHSIYNGFTALETDPKYKHRQFPYHGELVFFGTLVEMILDGYPKNEIVKIMEFGHRIGLPINLEELGFKEISDEDIMKVAKAATKLGETIHNKSYRVTPEMVFNAIKIANEIGLTVAEKIPKRKFKR